ncbi:hypothetical protein JEQ12_003913 [Ovis aries]|uniref:Uncharacterized protein n=1 Tax=Ovis aries TaxID=9940 RepID=A0A836A3Y2_SHEEP|nr:hypothetical protein JEQ12_003913 [Ovis aries]
MLAWPEESPSRQASQAANTTCQAPFLWAVGPAPALTLNALDTLNPAVILRGERGELPEDGVPPSGYAQTPTPLLRRGPCMGPLVNPGDTSQHQASTVHSEVLPALQDQFFSLPPPTSCVLTPRGC